MTADPALPQRVAAGAGLAAAIAWAAWKAGSLRTTGAVAAVIVGTVAIAAGWRWGGLLVAYFVTASVLSRIGAHAKARRTESVIAKGGARDAAQVAANGGVFALAALAAIAFGPTPFWSGLGVGALAASSADTWGTEVGTLVGGTPRMVVGWRQVAPGTSGGVTAAGSAATLAGALFVAGLAAILGWPASVALGAAAGGVLGALADSLLGATLQQRRWCERCKAGTERPVHSCGAATIHRGGLAWLENDRVNLLASLVGAAASGALAFVLARAA